MKEIKRIHIAKVPYDVELEAKKELETYLQALELHNDDKDMLGEVEVRITEILQDRGVRRGAVITSSDVKALRRQLGEPHEFHVEQDVQTEMVEEVEYSSDRKLFRDTDHAELGGVLAGIAAYFRLDATPLRIIFVILFFVSGGLIILIYLLLWAMIPPARTAADHLRMVGRSVTLNSIREMNETIAQFRDTKRRRTRRMFTVFLGVTSIIMAGVLVTATIMVVAYASGWYSNLPSGADAYPYIGASVLAVISGVLLTVLFTLTAYAAFMQKMTRRILVTICVMAAAGFLSFGGAIGCIQYANMQRSHYIDANTRTKTISLPSNAAAITALVADTQGITVKYHALNSGNPYAQLRAVVSNQANLPVVTATVKDATLTIRATRQASDACSVTMWWCDDTRPTLEIYAPIVTLITLKKDALLEYRSDTQPTLAIHAGENTSVDVLPGMIDEVTVVQSPSAVVSLTQATVSRLVVSTAASSVVEAGTVRMLSVRDGGSCPSTYTAQVNVWRVTEGMMDINDKRMSAKTTDSGCTEINIEGDMTI